MNRLQTIRQAIRSKWLAWCLIMFGFATAYYAVLMLSLVIRFGDLPNYVTFYDWFGNVQTIIASTPSWSDTMMIIRDEWLVEIGFMNYDYGMGLSEWSLFLMPAKMLSVLLLGALLATQFVLLHRRQRACSTRAATSARAAAGFGASCVALASITLSWVVCCSTPTWVVGLAMMGLGVSTSLWLEPLGGWMTLLGFIAMGGAIYLAAGSARLQRESASRVGHSATI